MNNDTTNAIIDVQRRFWQALQTKDATLFEQVLDDNYMCRWVDAHAEAKATFIQNLVSFPGTITLVESNQLEVTVVSDTVVLTGVQVARCN